MNSAAGMGAVQPALAEIDFARLEVVGLVLALDAFGHGQQIERAGHADDVLGDLVGGRIGADGIDEGLVDFQRIERQALQVGQAGIARAEVVDGHGVAQPARLGDDGTGGVHVHETAFGGLEPDLARLDGRVQQHALEHPQHFAVLHVAGAQVDRDMHAAVDGEQLLHVPDHQPEHLGRDTRQDAVFLGDGDERPAASACRRDVASAPAPRRPRSGPNAGR